MSQSIEKYLKSLGVKAEDGFMKIILLEDAVVHVYVDSYGYSRADVYPFDYITTDEYTSVWELDAGDSEIVDAGYDDEDYEEDDDLNVFDIGDIVTVGGYEGRVFEVFGITMTSSDDGVEYDLVDRETGEDITAYEEDMATYTSPAKKKEVDINGLIKDAIDRLLDDYNDVITLYEMFKDEEYKQRADAIMRDLKLVKFN